VFLLSRHIDSLSPVKAFIRRIPGAEVLRKSRLSEYNCQSIREEKCSSDRKGPSVIGKDHRSGVFLCLKNDVPLLSREGDREAVPLVFEDADDALAKLLEAGDEEGSVTQIEVERVIQRLSMAGFRRVLYKPSGVQHFLEMELEALAFVG
jgi:hypothetical protein